MAAVNTFMDTRAISVRVHEFGATPSRLIGLPSTDAAATNGAPADSCAQQLPPVVANDLVTITPVQLNAAPAGGAAPSDAAASAAEDESSPPNAKRARTDAGPASEGSGKQPCLGKCQLYRHPC